MPRITRLMDNCGSLDCKEGRRASKQMLSNRQESYLIGKSGCKGNREKDRSQVSSSSVSSGMIRVIHIFAPKIIKTDVGNFRELVQKLTGNTKRLRSGNKSKRSAKSIPQSITSSPPRTTQILSQYSDATNFFASSSRVEYSIPRSPDSYLSPPSILDFGLDFYQQEQDVNPRTRRQPSCIDFSGSSSDQSCCSPFLFAEVTRGHFYGHQSQKQNSFNADSNDGIGDGIPNSTMRSSRRQQQQLVSTSAPIMVDPFQSLSGYREKLRPAQRSSTSAFLLGDELSHVMLTNRFSDMDTLTGLVTPGLLRKIPMALAHHVNNSSDFTFQRGL